MNPILGSTGTGPVVGKDGSPRRAADQLDNGRPPAADAETGGSSSDDGPATGGSPAAPPPRREVLGRRSTRALLGTVVPVLLLVLWHVSTEVTGFFAPWELPSPGSVLSAGVELYQRGTLGTHIGISVQRVLLGFTFGALAGLAAGALVGLSRLADVLLSGSFGAVRAVPSLAWVPLLILWIGINEDSKVVLIAIGAFFPVYTTVASALRHVDRHLVEAGRAYGLKGLSLLTRVQLPAATPSVVAGLRLAMAQAWLFLVAAELIASSMGLGFLLTDSQNNGRVDRILLAIITLAVLGKTTDALIGVAEKRLLRRW